VLDVQQKRCVARALDVQRSFHQKLNPHFQKPNQVRGVFGVVPELLNQLFPFFAHVALKRKVSHPFKLAVGVANK